MFVLVGNLDVVPCPSQLQRQVVIIDDHEMFSDTKSLSMCQEARFSWLCKEPQISCCLEALRIG